MISPMKLVYFWDSIWTDFEIWRFLTAFLYIGQFSFPTLITLYMLQSYSQRYEMEPYNTGAGGGTADYVFALMFGSVMIFVTYPFANALIPLPPLFARTLMFFVLYTWRKRHPTALTAIWGVQFKAIYLPFATLGLELLMGHLYSDILHGIAVGHVYYFLVDVVPLVYGKDVLHTPQFLIDKLGVGAYVAPAPAVNAGGRMGGIGNNTWQAPGRVNPPTNPAGPSRGYNWGSGGQRLGS